MTSEENNNQPAEDDRLDPAPTDPDAASEDGDREQAAGQDDAGAINDEPTPATPSATEPEQSDDRPALATAYDDVDDETGPAGDTDSIDDSGVEARSSDETGAKPDWEHETSVKHIAVELKHIEKEVRKILDSLDTRRKRRLTGTRRWLDLEEDMINWQFGGKFDAKTLARLRELITQRNHLFTRLKFLAGTRPTWNT